ncbi:MAG: CHAT domain-containing protein [Bacteroidetes bacterium]|nr:CHAT domain-containing protein [Bacteroidota bacterium]
MNSILKLGKEYNSEHLLLAYLLNQKKKSLREREFAAFYAQNLTTSKLYSINRSVVNETILGSKFYESKPDIFTLFLLGNYNRVVRVVDRKFYNYTIENNDRFFNQRGISELKRQLYLATYFNSLYTLNQFNQIPSIYDQLMDLDLFPISYEKRNLYWGLDYVMYSLGHLDRSLEVQREYSMPLSDYLGDQGGLDSIYSSYGGYLYILGKYREAREVFETTLSRSEDFDDEKLTTLYNNLSLVYFKTGESGKYIDTQLKALEHAKASQNYDDQIDIYRNLHIFYRKNQNFDMARKYIDEAAELAERIGNNEDLFSIFVSKSVFESNFIGDLDEAEQYLDQAEERLKKSSSSRFKIRILSERAQLLKKRHKYKESLELETELSDLALSQNNTSLVLEKLVQRSELQIIMENFKEASELLHDFKAHDISVVDFSILTLSRMLMAQLHHHKGEFTEAEQIYRETTDMVMERARYSADRETGYWTIEQEYMQLFEAYADFLMERGNTDRAIQLLDRVKTINDASMLQNPLITSTELTEEQLSRDRQITKKMEQLRRKLFVATGDERLELNNRLSRLQAQKRELFKHQRAMPANEKEVSIWSTQRLLRNDQMLLHLTNVNGNYYISRITRSSAEIDKIEITDNLEGLFEETIHGIVNGNADLTKLYRVGQILDIGSLSDTYSSLILMPDGYFHQLPVDVLPVSKPTSSHSYGATTYLIEKMDVRRLNRLSDIGSRSRNSGEFEYDYAGFGVSDFENGSTERSLISLPQAPGEVQDINKNLNRFSRRVSYIEEEATPRKFRQMAGKSRILHMATHSEISESDPLFSQLHLLPDGSTNDSKNQIFAYELFDLNLNNELVMLNSCESGGDRAIQGGGIMGLSRALTYAGAQSLVLNAWSVNDQFAADFAEEFYKHINNGESKSRALQLTKIDFIKSKNANPHYWGPYILNGNNRPLIQKPGTNLGSWILAALFIAGFILVSRSRQFYAAA